MPRPRRENEWDEAIKSLLVEKPPPGPQAIEARLKEAVRSMGSKADKLKPPARRTIGRRLAELRQLPPEELERYRRFRWPENMGVALPWEAGPAAFELVRWNSEHGLRPPLIALVRWFWRVTQLAPDAPFQKRYDAASQLNTLEVAAAVPENEAIRRSIELFLAFTPWRSKADAAAYKGAVKRTKIAAFSPHVTLRVTDEFLADVLSVITGWGMSVRTARELADYVTGVTDSPGGKKIMRKKGAPQ